MKENIIFLDIDGVLNGYNFWSVLGWNIACFLKIQNWYRKNTRSPFSVHHEKVKRLAKIVHKTNAKIVMSSTWRHTFWNCKYEEMNKNTQLLVRELQQYNIEVIDITPRSPDGKRYKEINEWLDKNSDRVKNFVILDDESFDLQCFVGTKLVKTSSVKEGCFIRGHWKENAGLKNRHVRKAIKILSS